MENAVDIPSGAAEMMASTTRIAGERTVGDWQRLKERLAIQGDAEPWKEAFDEFFHERLKTRYFAPIEVLETMHENNGEGFSIVVIQCSLIEFLASTVEGKIYRHRRNGDPQLRGCEYSNSGDMFCSVLTHYAPFKEMFANADAAGDFYSNVRCGLFHEARTKGKWRIRVCENAPQAIDTQSSIIYRNKMQEAFDQFAEWYDAQLRECAKMRKAFICKFDSLCED